MSIVIANVEVNAKADLKSIPTPELLAFYNLKTNRQTKKFKDRDTGENQVWNVVKAISSEEQEQTKPAAAPKPKKVGKKPFRFNFNFVPRNEPTKDHRVGTARALAIETLGSEGGATFEEIMKVTGWDEKKAYEGIRLIHFNLNWGMRYNNETKKITIYKSQFRNKA